MQTPERVEYEAIASDVFAESAGAFLVLEIATALGAKVALRMRRSTFDDLAMRIAKAHADLEKRAPHK